MKIVSHTTPITVDTMKDGQVAIIVKWGSDKSEHIGKIVQRFGTSLITLGSNVDQGWPCFFPLRTDCASDYLVSILPSGTLFEL